MSDLAKLRERLSQAVWMQDNRILDIDYDGDLPHDVAMQVTKLVVGHVRETAELLMLDEPGSEYCRGYDKALDRIITLVDTIAGGVEANREAQ